MPAQGIRVVLDTNTWLDLLWFRDPRCAGLAAALADCRVVAVASPACRDEWRRVLAYPALGIGDAERHALGVAFDARVALLADPPPSARLPRCRDRDDQKFLELALASGSAALVTRDAELLALAKRCRRDGLFAIVEPHAAATLLES